MARRTIIRRRRVIIYVVALWWNLLQQAIWLLMDSTTNRTTFADDENEVPRPLSYDREVYRRGFMFNTTRASDVNCISMLHMRRRIFWKLCRVLEEFGGLTRTRNVEVDEMVAMFLLTGCLGALDGTIINVRTRTASQARYCTRKGTTDINCLGVV
ncbi:hypothetical protein LINPERHAP1_LOCUS15434, partial [Linum perenne]